MDNSGDHHGPGLPPLAGESPSVLILGSYPSEISLGEKQYYANRTNHFWKIMGVLFSFEHKLPYSERKKILAEHGIALWDVIESCSRKGSLDSSICNEEYNDILTFLKGNPTIRCIALNGGKAGKSFRKYLKGLPENDRKKLEGNLKILIMPSTSAANARYSIERKVEEWQAILGYLDK